MVNVMGYFDDAIAERGESLEHDEFSGIIELSEEEYLEHGRFGSFRKAHKYIDRVWKNGKWFYRYKVTGKGYKDLGDRYANIAGTPQENNPRADEYRQKMLKKADEMYKKSETETVFGKAKDFFTPKETVTITDISTGKKRTSDNSIYDQIEKRSKKKKKFGFKHEDMDGSEFRYFPTRNEFDEVGLSTPVKTIKKLEHDGLFDGDILATKISDILE